MNDKQRNEIAGQMFAALSEAQIRALLGSKIKPTIKQALDHLCHSNWDLRDRIESKASELLQEEIDRLFATDEVKAQIERFAKNLIAAQIKQLFEAEEAVRKVKITKKRTAKKVAKKATKKKRAKKPKLSPPKY